MPFWASIGPSATSQIRGMHSFKRVRSVLDSLYPMINNQMLRVSKGLDPTLHRDLGGVGLPAVRFVDFVCPKFRGYLARGVRTLLYASNPIKGLGPAGAWSF